MAAIVTEQLRIKNAKDFIKASTSNPMYVAIGGVSPWADDNNPPIPGQSMHETTQELWDGLYASKRVNAGDVYHVIKKNLWVEGAVDFVQYDPRDNYLSQKKFHTTVVDDYSIRVYKLIIRGSGATMVKPIHTTALIPAAGADGYVWKYMYTVPIGIYNSFLNEHYIPVIQNLTQATNSASLGNQPAPVGGHGTDTIAELFAYTVGIITKFVYNEGGKIPAENEFRTVAIIENMKKFNGEAGSSTNTGDIVTSKIATGPLGLIATVLNLTVDPVDVIPGDVVKTATGTATVIGYDEEYNRLYVLPKTGSLTAGQTVMSDATALSTAITSITAPDVTKYAGNTLYTEYRKPVYRAGNQTEVISVIIEF